MAAYHRVYKYAMCGLPRDRDKHQPSRLMMTQFTFSVLVSSDEEVTFWGLSVSIHDTGSCKSYERVLMKFCGIVRHCSGSK